MRVISKYKDYYDSYMNDFSGNKWYREYKVIELYRYENNSFIDNELFSYFIKLFNDAPQTPCNVRYSAFLICGKLFYIYYTIDTENNNILYSSLDVRDIEKYLDCYHYKYKDSVWWWNRQESHIKTWKQQYNRPDIYDKLHIQFETPIIQIDKSVKYIHKYNISKLVLIFTLNPILSKYKFGKIINGFELYKSLEYYIDNILVKSNDKYIEFDDKYKIKAHGFNSYSFRKLPEKK